MNDSNDDKIRPPSVEGIKLPTSKTTVTVEPKGITCAAYGYWYDISHEDEMVELEKRIREEVRSRYTRDQYLERFGLEYETSKELLERHAVPFRELVFSKINNPNPNYSEENDRTVMYACPKCGTLRVREGTAFFFEERRAILKMKEERELAADWDRKTPYWKKGYPY